jgi:hypothetical protein
MRCLINRSENIIVLYNIKAIKERIIGIEVTSLVEVEWSNNYVCSIAS